MANVHDVAAYILEQAGSMTAMKLQKLVYYARPGHLFGMNNPSSTNRSRLGQTARSFEISTTGTVGCSSWMNGPLETLLL